MKIKFLFPIFLSLLLLGGCRMMRIVIKPKIVPAPILMKNVLPEMLTSGFWVSRTSEPDKPVLNAEETARFNAYISNDLKARMDIFTVTPFFSKTALISAFEKSLSDFASRKLYFSKTSKPGRVYYYKIGGNINVSEILYDGVNQYGLVIKTAALRALPISKPLYKDHRDTESDELLKYTLDIGTPLVIQHQTFDKRWYYVMSPYANGWVEAGKVVECELEEAKEYLSKAPFCVITSARAGVFLDPELSRYYGYITMGARLPLGKRSTEDIVHAVVPYKDKDNKLVFGDVFIRKKNTHQGYLEYTPRNILNQAFEFLNEPYGQSNIYSFCDNKIMLEKVFATAGVFLPVYYSSTTVFGSAAAVFDPQTTQKEKLDSVITSAAGGSTLLFTENEPYLYLGFYEGIPYTIRELWDYEEQIKKKKTRKVVIKRVAVTDLLLENNTPRKALIDRILSVRLVKN